MAVRANISKGYIWRPGLIGVAALLFSAWFFYDGLVKYPLQKQMYEEHTRIYQENPDPIEAARVWKELADNNGWSTAKPTGKTDNDIFTQKLLGFITAPIGLYFLFGFMTSLGKWVEADERGVRTRSGQEARYEAITSIDKSRWQSKGIAVVNYEDNGQSGRIVLDDWKFERDPTKRILEVIDERMPGGAGGAVEEDENGFKT